MQLILSLTSMDTGKAFGHEPLTLTERQAGRRATRLQGGLSGIEKKSVAIRIGSFGHSTAANGVCDSELNWVAGVLETEAGTELGMDIRMEEAWNKNRRAWHDSRWPPACLSCFLDAETLLALLPNVLSCPTLATFIDCAMR
ncbi:hypothetical protein KCU65_g208, partial [Aureobasidium melanogenum]